MKKRIVYFDYLRVAAMVAVIVLHVSAEKWYEFDGRSLAWNLVNGCNGIVRWGVPVFIMISGALFLQRDVQIGALYKKNILRLLAAYLAWRVFYIVAEPMVWLLVTGSPGVFFRYAREKMTGSPTHMWFIPMIIGLYMCVPILREIVRKRKVAAYFLGLSFGVTFLLPQLKLMAGDFVGGTVGEVIRTLCGFVNDEIDIYLAYGFSFYFVLGYFLNETELSRKQRRIVYALGVLGFAATVGLNAIVAWRSNIPCETYYGNYRVNVLLEAVAVHTWFKYRAYGNEKADRIIFALAKYSFGAYLIHVFVIRVLMMTGLEDMMYTPALGVPVVAVLTVTLSFAASWVIHKIPVLNKWIV